MTQSLRVGVVAEDANFASFLVPAITGLARRAGVPVAVFRPQTTSGCQAEALRRACATLSEGFDLIVVGADSGGAWHHRRAATFRQKARHLQELLGPAGGPVVWAVAHPSVEAWLLADAAAFRAAFESILGRFKPPAHWPSPSNEQEAKHRLANLVRDSTGDDLPRDGFEFADEVVSHIRDLRESGSDSLAQFARDLMRELERLRGEAGLEE